MNLIGWVLLNWVEDFTGGLIGRSAQIVIQLFLAPPWEPPLHLQLAPREAVAHNGFLCATVPTTSPLWVGSQVLYYPHDGIWSNNFCLTFAELATNSCFHDQESAVLSSYKKSWALFEIHCLNEKMKLPRCSSIYSLNSQRLPCCFSYALNSVYGERRKHTKGWGGGGGSGSRRGLKCIAETWNSLW